MVFVLSKHGNILRLETAINFASCSSSIWFHVTNPSSFKPTNLFRSAATSALYNKIQQNSYPLPTEGTGPLRVKIGTYIEALGRFQSGEMSFDADLYLYMNW